MTETHHDAFYAKYGAANEGRRPQGRVMGPVKQVKAYRERTPQERRLIAGINDWERQTGMNYHRKAINDPEEFLVRLQARRLQSHRDLHHAARTAPKSDRVLYRGIQLSKDDVAAIQPGQRIHRGMESWTDAKDKAERFPGEQAARRPRAYRGKDQTAVLEMHPGSRAMNIQGVARYNMSEWVADRPYRVLERSVDENGIHRIRVQQTHHFHGNQYVDANRRRVSKSSGYISIWGINHGSAS